MKTNLFNFLCSNFFKCNIDEIKTQQDVLHKRELKKIVSNKQSMYNALFEKYDNICNKHHNILSKFESLKGEYATLFENHSSNITTIKTLKHKIDKFVLDIKELSEKNLSLNSLIADKNKTISSLNKSLSKKDEEIEELKSKLFAKNNIIRQKESVISEEKLLSKRKTRKIKQLDETVKDLWDDVVYYSDRNEKMTQKINGLI